jgi:hypothetical protein
MARKIDTDAEIYNIRLKEQAGDVVAVDAGYFHAYMKETGLYWEDDAEIVAGPIGAAFEPGGRLTLTTGTPVTTADVTAAATLYYTPYKHDMISLYDGARWIPKTFTELSLNIAAYTASKPYDIWAYLNTGAVALDSTVWTNATTRATALAYQNGRLVKNGATTRLYLGTIYINSSGGQTDDALLKRDVWNYYNRIGKRLYLLDETDVTYGTAAWRLYNNTATNLVNFCVGVAEEWTTITARAYGKADAAGRYSLIGAGYDSVTPTDESMQSGTDSTEYVSYAATMNHLPAAGYHYYGLCQYSGVGNCTNLRAMLDGKINC